MYTQEELFNRFQTLSESYRQLSGIVQNSGQITTHEELDEFEARIDFLVSEMQKMRHLVVSHYQRENKIV